MLELILIVCFAIFFHSAGEAINSSGFLWGALSVTLWIGSAYFLGWFFIGKLCTQVGLFVAFTVWNSMRNPKRTPPPR